MSGAIIRTKIGASVGAAFGVVGAIPGAIGGAIGGMVAPFAVELISQIATRPATFDFNRPSGRNMFGFSIAQQDATGTEHSGRPTGLKIDYKSSDCGRRHKHSIPKR